MRRIFCRFGLHSMRVKINRPPHAPRSPLGIRNLNPASTADRVKLLRRRRCSYHSSAKPLSLQIFPLRNWAHLFRNRRSLLLSLVHCRRSTCPLFLTLDRRLMKWRIVRRLMPIRCLRLSIRLSCLGFWKELLKDTSNSVNFA